MLTSQTLKKQLMKNYTFYRFSHILQIIFDPSIFKYFIFDTFRFSIDSTNYSLKNKLKLFKLNHKFIKIAIIMKRYNFQYDKGNFKN